VRVIVGCIAGVNVGVDLSIIAGEVIGSRNTAVPHPETRKIITAGIAILFLFIFSVSNYCPTMALQRPPTCVQPSF